MRQNQASVGITTTELSKDKQAVTHWLDIVYGHNTAGRDLITYFDLRTLTLVYGTFSLVYGVVSSAAEIRRRTREMDKRLWVYLRTRFITTASVSRHLGVQGIMANHYRPQVKIKVRSLIYTYGHLLWSTDIYIGLRTLKIGHSFTTTTTDCKVLYIII